MFISLCLVQEWVGISKTVSFSFQYDGFTVRRHGPHRLSVFFVCSKQAFIFLIFFVPLACPDNTETCDEKRSPVSLMNHHHHHTTLEDSLVFILQGGAQRRTLVKTPFCYFLQDYEGLFGAFPPLSLNTEQQRNIGNCVQLDLTKLLTLCSFVLFWLWKGRKPTSGNWRSPIPIRTNVSSSVDKVLPPSIL